MRKQDYFSERKELEIKQMVEKTVLEIRLSHKYFNEKSPLDYFINGSFDILTMSEEDKVLVKSLILEQIKDSPDLILIAKKVLTDYKL